MASYDVASVFSSVHITRCDVGHCTSDFWCTKDVMAGP